MEIWLFLLVEALVVGGLLWLVYRWQQRWLARRRETAARDAEAARRPSAVQETPATPETETPAARPRPSYGAARYRTRRD
jgi:hypothetical protein